MKKKSVFIISALMLIVACIFVLVACDNNNENNGGNNNTPSAEWGEVYTVDAAYARAADLGYAGSLEEFIALISGKDGIDGTNGKDGKDGINGTDGKDGINGTNGKDGVDGINGINGKDGIDGKDGVGIVDIELTSSGNLIIRLSNNESIDLGTVFKCEHSYSDWQTVLEPTCTAVGYDVRTCTKCDSKDYKFYEQLGHEWDDASIAIEPNCFNRGLKIYGCLVCDATRSEILEKRHNYVDGVCTVCETLEPTEDLLDFTPIEVGYSVRINLIEQQSAKNIVIPDTYNGLPVTQIEINGFRNCTELESIYIPNSITSIMNDAFANCSKLKNIHIPESVTYINKSAFIRIPLENITIDKRNSVYHSAGNCIIETESKTLLTGCQNSVIPSDGSVVKIGSYAFYHSALTSIIIPESIVEIEDYAFGQCIDLKVVYNFSDLDIVKGSANHGFVAYYAEDVYTALDNDTKYDSIMFTLTNDLTGYEVHARNKSITSAEIPETYKGLPVKEIGDSAFTNCTELESIQIADSITRIGNNAFARCTKLKSLNIPKSVTNIGRNILTLSGVENITVEEGNPVFHSDGNCIIETESKTLIVGINNSIIPRDGSVKIIGEYAFLLCEELTQIVIPECIVEIKERAFMNCTALKTVYNLSALDITVGSSKHGNIGSYAENIYTTLEENVL